MQSAPTRSLRNGKFFSPYMLDDACIAPNFRIGDLITRHATGPQDSDSDDEDDDSPSDPIPPAVLSAVRKRWAPTSAPADSPTGTPVVPVAKTPAESPAHQYHSISQHRPTTLLSAACQRWEPSSKPSSESPSTSADPIVLSKKDRKTEHSRAARKAKREVLREVEGVPKAPKAIVRVRVRQASPVATSFRHWAHAVIYGPRKLKVN
ncbi:hypothetical protein B0H16DRAFT_1474096 [Mycena metata]|uniref:Uncharacterized protein n=1 Tax=Mycena metata TaxID=1033252 RepID=A0AAD7HHY7_9AGAR|nr:hypothetical protein B0H16DRAFT_1474096 [Mycena metata]